MASDAINIVLDAEKSTNEQIEAAKTEAQDIIERTKRNCAEEYDKMISDAKEKKRISVETAKNNAEESINKARLTAQTEAQDIINNYEKMTDKAVKAILDVIV